MIATALYAHKKCSRKVLGSQGGKGLPGFSGSDWTRKKYFFVAAVRRKYSKYFSLVKLYSEATTASMPKARFAVRRVCKHTPVQTLPRGSGFDLYVESLAIVPFPGPAYERK